MSALVIDIGSSSLRTGYAGDDIPKAIIPSHYGYKTTAATAGDGDVQMGENAPENGETTSKPPSDSNLYLGQNGPSIWREGMEIGNPVRDALSE